MLKRSRSTLFTTLLSSTSLPTCSPHTNRTAHHHRHGGHSCICIAQRFASSNNNNNNNNNNNDKWPTPWEQISVPGPNSNNNNKNKNNNNKTEDAPENDPALRAHQQARIVQLMREEVGQQQARHQPGRVFSASATPVATISSAATTAHENREDEDHAATAATTSVARSQHAVLQKKTSTSAPATAAAAAAQKRTTPKTKYQFDDDEGELHLFRTPPSGQQGVAHADALVSSTADTPADSLTRIEILEQELIDDTHVFFPPLPDHLQAAPSHKKKEEEGYVPGQEIIPAGWTRYRLEVQYQGSDFDGWSKSTARRTAIRRVHDGAVVRILEDEEKDRHAGARRGLAAAADGNRSLLQAKAVLEEALAVAVDVPSVDIVASVIPEVGASVRRLTCHVDLPSEIEMQPRTILQRATLWLQQRQQPLALLVCQPCRNQQFHARHDGVQRVYVYRILNRIAPPLFDAGLQWHVDRHLDVPRMQRAAALLEGTHDFGYFADPKMYNALRRAAASRPDKYYQPHQDEHAPIHGNTEAPKVAFEKGLSQLERAAALPTFNAYGQRVIHYDAKPARYQQARTNLPTIRTLDALRVVRQDDEVLLWFTGKNFLRHQIRHLASVLRAVGQGLWDEQELQHALTAGFETSRARFRRERLPPAPAYGLTLWEVKYPPQHGADEVAFVDAGPLEDLHQSSVN